MKKIFLCTMLCICSIFMVGCGCSTNKEPVDRIDQDELSGKFYDDQVVDGIAIKNFNIAVENGGSYIAFDAENTMDQAISVEYIKIYLYDKTDYVILESYGYIGGTLSIGETKHIVVETDIELSNIARVAYQKM